MRFSYADRAKLDESLTTLSLTVRNFSFYVEDCGNVGPPTGLSSTANSNFAKRKCNAGASHPENIFKITGYGKPS